MRINQPSTEQLQELLLDIYRQQDTDALQAIVLQKLVSFFGYDYAVVLQQIGSPERYIRKQLFATEDRFGQSAVPLEFKVAIGSWPSKEWATSDVHPCTWLYHDPLSTGHIGIGLPAPGTAYCVLAYSRNKPRMGAKTMDLFWRTVRSHYSTLGGTDILLHSIAEPMPEMGQMELKLRQLEESNQELKQFASRASHDLQEPLRTISNYITLFLRNHGAGLESEGREYLGFAKNAAERMHHLVKDLLTYTRLDHTSDQMTEVSCNKVLETALDNIKMSVEESDAIILYEDLPEINGHEQQLVSLFQNLLDNAIKFRGDDDPVVMVQVEDAGQTYEFSVCDNGIGIPDDFHDKIFQFFTKLHPASEYKGTGLGLSICKKIVENHGGQIRAESADKEGTTFIFQLSR